MHGNCSPLAWWLMAGPICNKRVLVLGSMELCDSKTLASLSSKCSNFTFEAIGKNDFNLSEKLEEKQSFDVVIISMYRCDNEQLLSLHKILWDIDLIKCDILNDDSVFCVAGDRGQTLKFLARNVLSQLWFYFRGGTYIAKSYFKKFNLKNSDVKYTTVYTGKIHDIYCKNIYISQKNIFLLKEKIKKHLFSGVLSKYFHNTYIYTGTSNPLGFRSFNGLMKVVSQAFPDLELTINRITIKPGKLIFFTDNKNEESNNYIIIAAIDDDAIKQRLNEYHTLLALKENNEINKYIPLVYAPIQYDGIDYFIVEELPGVTVDFDNAALENKTYNAYQSLCDLSISTSYKVSFEDETFSDFILDTKNKFISQFPEYKDKTVLIDKYIDINFAKGIFSMVTMHGDYKIENVIFERNSNKVVGIIDWELSNLTGLPLIDVFFLIVYNKIIQGHDFLSAFELLLNNKQDSKEDNYIKDYCKKFNISEEYKNILYLIFILHHFSFRYTVGSKPKDFDKMINRAFNLVT